MIFVFIFFVQVSLFNMHTTVPDKSSRNAIHFFISEDPKPFSHVGATLVVALDGGSSHFYENDVGATLAVALANVIVYSRVTARVAPTLMSLSSENNIPEYSLCNILDYIWCIVFSSDAVRKTVRLSWSLSYTDI